MTEIRVAVVMGVSGSGKTTIGRRLAETLGWRFQEGDALHSAANVEKMRAAIPLTDADRAPWLASIASVIDGWLACGEHGVLTCSALKRAYRDIIIGRRPGVALVYLKGSKALIAERLASRHGHYMPLALLDSQFATLEEPGGEERPIVVEIGGSPDAVAGEIVVRLTNSAGIA